MKKINTLYIVIVLLASCTPQISTQSLPPIPVTSVVPTSGLFVSTSTFTPSMPPPITPSPTYIPTTSPLPKLTSTLTVQPVQFIQNCLPLSKSALPNNQLSGRIPLSKSNAPYDSAFLLDLNSYEKINFSANPDEDIYFIGVSPDGKWVSFEIRKRDRDTASPGILVVADYNGKIHARIIHKSYWFFDLGWADSTHVIIFEKNQDGFYDSLHLLNPFTNEEITYSAEKLPHLYPGSPGPWGLMYHPPIAFAPTLTYLVYAKAGEYRLKLSIWDMAENKEKYLVDLYTRVQPAWSNDGKNLAILANLLTTVGKFQNEELYISSINGQVSRVTFLNDMFEQVDLSDPSWSSDGRYIAFGIKTGPFQFTKDYPVNSQNEYRLAILDTQSNIVTDYCIPFYGSMHPPIWSPDNQYLIVWRIFPEYRQSVYLVDLQSQAVIDLSDEGFVPAGWMIND